MGGRGSGPLPIVLSAASHGNKNDVSTMNCSKTADKTTAATANDCRKMGGGAGGSNPVKSRRDPLIKEPTVFIMIFSFLSVSPLERSVAMNLLSNKTGSNTHTHTHTHTNKQNRLSKLVMSSFAQTNSRVRASAELLDHIISGQRPI